MTAVERRNELSEFSVDYCVYGNFRDGDGDEGFRDTRWISLHVCAAMSSARLCMQQFAHVRAAMLLCGF